MRAIIVEDEKHARDNLEKLLLQIDPDMQIQAKLDSVRGTVAWLQANDTDLIFLDIHLADDLSFKIFEQTAVKAPVIFTTAYDQYALRAFKVNSLDYLLKPIDKEELAQSLEKYRATRPVQPPMDVNLLLRALQQPQRNYQQRFLVTRREKILSIKADDIAYFEYSKKTARERGPALVGIELKSNATDNDSAKMATSKGVIQGYAAHVSGNPIIPSCGNRIFPTHQRKGAIDGTGRTIDRRFRCTGPEGPVQRNGYRVRIKPGHGGHGDWSTTMAGNS